jgi:hypothetical protein
MDTQIEQGFEHLARLLAWRELALRYLDRAYKLDMYDRGRAEGAILDYRAILPQNKLYLHAEDFVDNIVRFVNHGEDQMLLKETDPMYRYIMDWFKLN